MVAFPTDIKPQSNTGFDYPSALVSRSHGGVWNHRDATTVGRSWSESYFSDVQSNNFKKLQAIVRQYHREGTVFTILHQDYLTANGAIAGGSIKVKGGSQTGASLVVDGASNSIAGWLVVGDLFHIDGINHSFEVMATVTTTSSGVGALSISPPIFSGGSPADNASCIATAVPINAFVASYDMPSSDANNYGVLRVNFVEQV